MEIVLNLFRPNSSFVKILAGADQKIFYGKHGMEAYLNENRTLIEKEHKTAFMYPVEEELFDKVDFSQE